MTKAGKSIVGTLPCTGPPPRRHCELAAEGQWPVTAPAGDTECIMHLIGALQLIAERQASSLFTSLQSICPLSVLISAKKGMPGTPKTRQKHDNTRT